MSEPQSKKTKIMSLLSQLKDLTTVVADTGDFQGKTRWNSNSIGGDDDSLDDSHGEGELRQVGRRGREILLRLHFFSERVVSRDRFEPWMIIRFGVLFPPLF